MAEQAFESITMSQIAERAGVGRTAVYNHFADKEVLLLAYMRQVTEEFTRVLTARLEAEPDPLMRLRLYIRAHLQMISRYHVKAGMGLRRQMSGRGASHLHDHAGMVGAGAGGDLYFARPGCLRGERASCHRFASPFRGIVGAPRPLIQT